MSLKNFVQHPPANVQTQSFGNTTTANIISSPLPTNNNEVAKKNLFSEREITSLTFIIISELPDCKNKQEQFNVIAQLAIKYLLNSY